MREIKKGVCSFCRIGCDVGIVTDGWKVLGVEYPSGSGVNDGSLCARGNAAAAYLDHPKRLVFPVHNGREIRWPEAFSEILSVLKSAKPGEIALTYDRNLTEEEYGLVWQLAERMGVENLSSSYLEPEFYFNAFLPRVKRAGLEEISKSHHFFLVGDVFDQAPVISRHVLASRFASKQGKVVALDSYASHTASVADLFLQVKPGMEPLALLALSSMVSGGGDKARVDEYVAAAGADSSLLAQIADSLGSERTVVMAATALGRATDPLLLSGAAQHLTTQLSGGSAFLPLGESFGKPGKVDFVDVLNGIESGAIKVLLNFGEVFPHAYPQLQKRLEGLSDLISTVTLKSDIGELEGTWLPTSLNLEKAGTLDTAFGPRKASPVVDPYSGAKSVEEIVTTIASEMSLSVGGGKAAIPELSLEQDSLAKRASSLLAKRQNGLVLIGEKPAFGFRGFFDEELSLKANPLEAARIEARDGDVVRLKTSGAEMSLKLDTTERVPAGVVVVPVHSIQTRALFESSIEGKAMVFGPQSVELWKEKG